MEILSQETTGSHLQNNFKLLGLDNLANLNQTQRITRTLNCIKYSLKFATFNG